MSLAENPFAEDISGRAAPHAVSPQGNGPRLYSAAWERAGHRVSQGLRPEPRDLIESPARPLRSLAFLMGVLGLGTVLGIGSAALIVERERPFATTSIGPWSASPTAGTAEADPYSVAIYTRSARVPLALGEGLALTAYTDSVGQSLSPACTYRITGSTPTARLWTLSAATAKGEMVETLAGRTFLTSLGLLRADDGTFTVTASRKPSSGNWLPLARQPQALEGLSFTFRLYDAPVTTGASLEGAVMPRIEKVACR